MGINYDVAFRILRPGAMWLSNRKGDYVHTATSYSDAQGRPVPTQAEADTAYNDTVAAAETQATAGRQKRNQMRALLRSPAPTDLADARQQIQGLKLALRQVIILMLGLSDDDE